MTNRSLLSGHTSCFVGLVPVARRQLVPATEHQMVSTSSLDGSGLDEGTIIEFYGKVGDDGLNEDLEVTGCLLLMGFYQI